MYSQCPAKSPREVHFRQLRIVFCIWMFRIKTSWTKALSGLRLPVILCAPIQPIRGCERRHPLREWKRRLEADRLRVSVHPAVPNHQPFYFPVRHLDPAALKCAASPSLHHLSAAPTLQKNRVRASRRAFQNVFNCEIKYGFFSR